MFGEFPEDGLSTPDSATKALAWVEVILIAADKYGLAGKTLVAAAKSIAGGFGNFTDCVRENMRGHMREHDGVATA